MKQYGNQKKKKLIKMGIFVKQELFKFSFLLNT